MFHLYGYMNNYMHIKNLNNIKIIGHSSGSVLSISFINTLLYFQPKLNINIQLITTGLGKCVSYLLDVFENNLRSHPEIEYYDILNMLGDPKNEKCWRRII